MREVIYKGRDNTNDFLLTADGQAVDLSGVTKMELVFSDALIVNSNDSPEMFNWSAGAGKIELTLGFINSLEKGEKYKPDLIVYDAENEFGINWGEISVVVK